MYCAVHYGVLVFNALDHQFVWLCCVKQHCKYSRFGCANCVARGNCVSRLPSCARLHE